MLSYRTSRRCPKARIEAVILAVFPPPRARESMQRASKPSPALHLYCILEESSNFAVIVVVLPG